MDDSIWSWSYFIAKRYPWREMAAWEIEIPYTYKVYGRIDQKWYLRKKMKGIKWFFEYIVAFYTL